MLQKKKSVSFYRALGLPVDTFRSQWRHAARISVLYNYWNIFVRWHICCRRCQWESKTWIFNYILTAAAFNSRNYTAKTLSYSYWQGSRGGTVCSNGFYADIWSQHQMQQYQLYLKSFLSNFGSSEVRFRCINTNIKGVYLEFFGIFMLLEMSVSKILFHRRLSYFRTSKIC